MTLHDARGGGFNQMFLELCFSVKLHDERGDSNQMLLEPCFSVTLHDERGGFPSNAPRALLFYETAG